ncbi:MAG: hypothetical protein AAGA75_24555 [Cyanobacteria bacterium P01_E01_bin.6]
MAKRRNLKKEKALRNQAYARKFRKRSNSRFGRRRSYNNNEQSDGNQTDGEGTENQGAADA